ncbi:mazG nucleotide pyrophosphohydrolase domain-containing protein [Striga asiatica]|uniref:MazG nucleotide pyrophosphohydrolase domain-containing protein n=1 Tax=Striga asiatica TaxID=4170 RepID=A0A5A7PWP8_STRAF|nr:mazG nucleotide pyrophosphohydrolase domain-containing protein [Striga asiatica]
MYRSCEKHSLDSAGSVSQSFSSIRRTTAPVFPVTALNSARTVVPRATSPYRIAIALGVQESQTIVLANVDRRLAHRTAAAAGAVQEEGGTAEKRSVSDRFVGCSAFGVCLNFDPVMAAEKKLDSKNL